jgi:hypothetical protein
MTHPAPVRVIKVNGAPMLKNPAMQSGFPTEARAKAWAECHGHPMIYYWHRMERVYFEKKVKA